LKFHIDLKRKLRKWSLLLCFFNFALMSFFNFFNYTEQINTFWIQNIYLQINKIFMNNHNICSTCLYLYDIAVIFYIAIWLCSTKYYTFIHLFWTYLKPTNQIGRHNLKINTAWCFNFFYWYVCNGKINRVMMDNRIIFLYLPVYLLLNGIVGKCVYTVIFHICVQGLLTAS
jgi:hypothetical protein